MKFNKWSVGLVAVGAVSLASVARAEEHGVLTSLANTTLSGYVDTSVQWNVGGDTTGFPPYAFNGAHKADGFNLNVVELNLEKPQDESDHASGFKISILAGPDAVGFNTSANAITTSAVTGTAGTNVVTGTATGGTMADFAIKQAYVVVRVPIGNGVDFKIGTFDTIIGYEVFEAGSNPNFTHSYGYTIEPTQHTGILASYKAGDNVSLSVGLANTLTAGIDARRGGANVNENRKTVMAAIALTAPKGWGFLEGSALYAGFVRGFAGSISTEQVNYYVGAVVKTPVAGLTVGAAWDHVDSFALLGGGPIDTIGLYTSYQVPDSKWSLHGRGEYVGANDISGLGESVEGLAVTGTLQYDWWKNVISRLEVRWDHTRHDVAGFGGPNPGFGVGPLRADTAVTVLANFIYKF